MTTIDLDSLERMVSRRTGVRKNDLPTQFCFVFLVFYGYFGWVFGAFLFGDFQWFPQVWTNKPWDFSKTRYTFYNKYFELFFWRYYVEKWPVTWTTTQTWNSSHARKNMTINPSQCCLKQTKQKKHTSRKKQPKKQNQSNKTKTTSSTFKHKHFSKTTNRPTRTARTSRLRRQFSSEKSLRESFEWIGLWLKIQGVLWLNLCLFGVFLGCFFWCFFLMVGFCGFLNEIGAPSCKMSAIPGVGLF